MTKTTRTWAICIVLCLLSFTKLVAQEIKFEEYSFSEFFQMIADEEDSVFTLSNAMISFNEETDQRFRLNLNPRALMDFTSSVNDSIIVVKTLILNNIYFNPSGFTEYSGIGKVIFTKPIECTNCINFIITQSTFNSTVTFRFNDQIQSFESLISKNRGAALFINNSVFQSGFELIAFADKRYLQYIMIKNVIHASQEKNQDFSILATAFQDFIFNNNIVEGSAIVWLDFQTTNTQNQSDQKLFNLEIIDNDFNVPEASLGFNDQNIDYVKIIGNQWSGIIITEVSELDRVNTLIDGPALIGRLIDQETYLQYDNLQFNNPQDYADLNSEERIALYKEKLMIEDVNFYNSEVALRGLFKDHFDSRHDAVSANLFYIEIKDLETRRLAYLYHQAPSFDSFFRWKINQFLKIFSAYGTEPARAITFSVYVIIAFALVYLFFPNHWDSHGKDRILHRYQFFFKYLNKDAGMHDVYLEGKQDELAHYDGFKNFFIENGKTVPKFFLATSLPLYRWSIASTRTTSWFLQKIDIFKGKWADLPAPQRAAKTVLLTLAFSIALLYDIFIKMLNALMLSINTFTTLGFGEIPIKGLPRYLAIIQGFIGWFMLTIFSVSLISQLLN
jgi:hypothetical protein